MDMHSANGSIKAAVIKAVKENPDLTYAEIADLEDVKPYQVAVWANEAGIFRRPKRGTARAQDDGLDERIRQLEHELSKARQLKAAQEIRFEREGSKVAVYGLGAQPLVADHKDWLRFLRKNGASTLREFIEAQFGSANGNGTVQ
jgi:hypothetical protein